ncbi:MAG: CpaE family protein [Methyloceanibacter sp.]
MRGQSGRSEPVIGDAAFSLGPAPGEPGSGRASEPFGASRLRPIPRVNIQAFCEDQDTAAAIEKAAQDRRLTRARLSVQMGGIDGACAFYRNAETPNLVIVESLLDRANMLAELERLAGLCDPATKVMVVGHLNDVVLYRELLRRGVSEYLVAPVGVLQVIETLSSLYSDPRARPIGQTIAFVGAKGGSGSSTVCHNAAFAIASALEREVVIADFDLAFGTAGLDFNQDPPHGIADALASAHRFDALKLDRLLSRCSDYLSLFAAPGTLDRAYDLEAAACEAVLEVVRDSAPWIALDVPHLWTDWAKELVMRADHVVVTAVPDIANLRNARNLIDQIKTSRPNDRPPLLVLNQVGLAKRPEVALKDFGVAVGLVPCIVVDFDAQLFGTAANNGQMIEEVASRSKAAEAFRKLAGLLTDRSERSPERPSALWSILARLKGATPGT